MKSPALIFTLFFSLFVAPVATESARAESLINMTVWKSPNCGCCTNWVAHMRRNGFNVIETETDDIGKIKKQSAIPERLQACHTAKVGDYVIEGHVHAKEVKRLLKTKLAAHGLAVPGMPSGSPGMENGQYDHYDVLLFKRDGSTKVFGSYP
jgi:hypothetical protein